MAIQYCLEGVKMPPIKRRNINQWIKEIATIYHKKVGDISYIFCDDKKILEINNEYLKHNYYTDIITFDYSEENIINGDIFISLDTVASNSKEYAISFEEELHRIIIHGILHLCGIEDKGEKERENMTLQENRALALLNEHKQ